MYLIVGLGNPGAEYENTRHNLGFRVIEELARRLGIKTLKSKCHSFIAETKISDHKIIIAQPQTFMNNSGPAVRGLLEWYKIDTANLILIYDDVDLEVGQLRLREKGNAGGHHGVESVINSVGTTHFPRVRIGIGRESLTADVTDYVLQKIPADQQEALEGAIISAAEAAESILQIGLPEAMNKFNS
jgi:PTH1 family peptidyl-tRNA hydrolase